MPSLCRAHGPVLYPRADGTAPLSCPSRIARLAEANLPCPPFLPGAPTAGPLLLFSAPHPWAPDRRLRPVNAPSSRALFVRRRHASRPPAFPILVSMRRGYDRLNEL